MKESCETILDWLLRGMANPATPPVNSIADWKQRYDGIAATWSTAVDRAISGGFEADRTAYAFLAGFFAAMQRLLPELPGDGITAFCISEEGGAHPRAIKTTLEPLQSGSHEWRINGRKQFITCAPEAASILVAASTGTDTDGRNRIRLAHIERDATGVTIAPMPDLPFIPEIQHGTVELVDVTVSEDQLLPGDAYPLYIKPFRSIEDSHVTAGILGYLLRCAVLYQWPFAVMERLLGFVAGIRPLAIADPLAPQVHIALAGLQRSLNEMISELDACWEKAPGPEREAWQRDRAVLGIAGKARAARLNTAWNTYSGISGESP